MTYFWFFSILWFVSHFSTACSSSSGVQGTIENQISAEKEKPEISQEKPSDSLRFPAPFIAMRATNTQKIEKILPAMNGELVLAQVYQCGITGTPSTTTSHCFRNIEGFRVAADKKLQPSSTLIWYSHDPMIESVISKDGTQLVSLFLNAAYRNDLQGNSLQRDLALRLESRKIIQKNFFLNERNAYLYETEAPLFEKLSTSIFSDEINAWHSDLSRPKIKGASHMEPKVNIISHDSEKIRIKSKFFFDFEEFHPSFGAGTPLEKSFEFSVRPHAFLLNRINFRTVPDSHLKDISVISSKVYQDKTIELISLNNQLMKSLERQGIANPFDRVSLRPDKEYFGILQSSTTATERPQLLSILESPPSINNAFLQGNKSWFLEMNEKYLVAGRSYLIEKNSKITGRWELDLQLFIVPLTQAHSDPAQAIYFDSGMEDNFEKSLMINTDTLMVGGSCQYIQVDTASESFSDACLLEFELSSGHRSNSWIFGSDRSDDITSLAWDSANETLWVGGTFDGPDTHAADSDLTQARQSAFILPLRR